jgi:excisionase family DNA binding protein
MVHSLLLKAGIAVRRYRRRKPQVERRSDEWTIRELAEHIGVPEPTLYAWVQKGRLGSRLVRVGARHTILVHADDATVASLKAIRTTPLPWRRLPPPNQSTPPSPLTES